MRVTVKEMVADAVALAPTLPAEAAKLMTEMYTRLDVLHAALCEALEQRKEMAAEVQFVREQSEEVYAAGYNHGHLNTVDGIAYAPTVKDDFYELALKVIAEAETPLTDLWFESMKAEVMANAIPDGWKLIPEQIHIDADGIEAICSQCGDGGDNYGEFTDGIVWVGEVSIDGVFKYGLNVSSAEYPEEGAINIAEFERPEQFAEATSNGR